MKERRLEPPRSSRLRGEAVNSRVWPFVWPTSPLNPPDTVPVGRWLRSTLPPRDPLPRAVDARRPARTVSSGGGAGSSTDGGDPETAGRPGLGLARGASAEPALQQVVAPLGEK